MDFLTIGIDIGGTNFRIGTLDAGGQILYFEKHSSRIFAAGNVLEVLSHAVIGYMTRYGITNRVRAVSMGVPSMVSYDRQTILSTPNLKGFDNLPLVRALSEKLGVRVFLERDVNFLLLHDLVTLGLDRTKTALGFYIGTGFGNALYLNGAFYTGKNGAAGELGHIPLYGINEPCTCGNLGCCEVRCSGRYLEALCAEHFPDTEIRNVFKTHRNHPILVSYVRDLAIPVAAELNILDPDYAILAGGVLSMADFPTDILRAAILEKTRKPYPAENLDMRFLTHTPKSGVYGGGLYARERLLSADADAIKTV